MSKYLKLFGRHSEYQTYAQSGDMIKPNVSYCEDNNEVHYNPIIPPETKLAVYYNIQNISSPTPICSLTMGINSMEVDGTLLNNNVTSYQFDRVGEHVVKYTFENPTHVGGSSNYYFSNIQTIERIVIGTMFTNIDSYAFYNCKSPIITMSNTITSLGQKSFGGCNNLVSMELSNNLISIDREAFDSCSGLTSITIPSAIEEIGHWVFNRCTSLTSITILATTPPTLGSGVFDNTNNCPIYVPAASVETYKAASGWSAVASRIQAIPTT